VKTLRAIAPLLSAIALAACGGTPTVTSNPVEAERVDRQIVSVCYQAASTTIAEIEEVARGACEKEGSGLRFWRHDRVFNNCPATKKTRASYICLPPPPKPLPPVR
jgi:hypothetical protein